MTRMSLLLLLGVPGVAFGQYQAQATVPSPPPLFAEAPTDSRGAFDADNGNASDYVPVPAAPVIQPPAPPPPPRPEAFAQNTSEPPSPPPMPAEPVTVLPSAPAPATPGPTAPAATSPTGGDLHAAAATSSDPVRQGRFFAQSDGALTAISSTSLASLAISLSAAGGYLFTPQLAAGAKLSWSDSAAGSLLGGGAFVTYHLSIGNPRIVPAIGGGVSVYSTSANNKTQAGFLVDATGQLEAFVTDSVAVVPYARVALGSLYGEPTVQLQLGWALAVYF